jgi:hypothetical protein
MACPASVTWVTTGIRLHQIACRRQTLRLLRHQAQHLRPHLALRLAANPAMAGKVVIMTDEIKLPPLPEPNREHYAGHRQIFESFDEDHMKAYATQAVESYKAQQQENAEPFAWATFDGEGSYDLLLYQNNESYKDEYLKRNGHKYQTWVFPLYAPQHQHSSR